MYEEASVLIGRKGTIDKPQYMETPFWTIDTLFYTKIHSDYIPKYIFYLFCTIDWQRLNEASGVPSLSAKIIENLEVKVAGKAEQKVIVQAMSSIDSQIAATQRLLAKYESIKKATVKLLGYPKRGWNKVCVGNLGEWFKGHGVTMKDTVSHGIPCTMYGDIYVKYKEFFPKADYYLPIDKAEAALHGQYGDLLFTASGETAEEIGKCSCYIGNTPLCIGGDIIVLRPSSDYDCKFLSYLLNSPACIHQKACLGQGDAVVHIKQENLQSIELYIPLSLEEQHNISAKIEAIDKALYDTETQHQKLQYLKQSMLQYFFG